MTKHLFNEFPEYTKQDWEDRIIKDLKDRPKEELTLQVEDGINIRPDYAGSSSKEYTQSYRSKNRWLISSELTVDCTNRDVLAVLANGCNSLLIHINSNTDITKLLKDVMLDIIDSTFVLHGNDQKSLERKLNDYLKTNYNSAIQAFAVSDPFENGTEFNEPTNGVFINAAHYRNSGATAIEELSYALAQLTEILVNDPKYIHIQLAIGPEYFNALAKFRAFRLMSAQIVKAFNWKGELRISAAPSTYFLSTKETNNNLLRLTSMAMSAALGGCDQLTLIGHDMSGNRSSERLALNIQHIMMEESYLASITDPALGSFYIEELTKEIAERAWSKFQQIESDGGFLNSLKNGNIKDQIDRSHGFRLKRFQSGESTLVGVSKYISDQSDAITFNPNTWNGISSRNLSEELGKEGENEA